MPFTSVTDKITVCEPTLVQLKVLLLRDMLAMPQTSALPLFTVVVGKLAFPALSNCTVTFLQIAVGGVISWTVTVAPHVLEFPFTSMTVNTTGFAPTFTQVKAVVFKAVEAMPQASVELLFTAAAVVDPVPAAFNCTVTFLQFAVGAIKSWTVTVELQVLELPWISVTVRTTILDPTAVQPNIV